MVGNIETFLKEYAQCYQHVFELVENGFVSDALKQANVLVDSALDVYVDLEKAKGFDSIKGKEVEGYAINGHFNGSDIYVSAADVDSSMEVVEGTLGNLLDLQDYCKESYIEAVASVQTIERRYIEGCEENELPDHPYGGTFVYDYSDGTVGRQDFTIILDLESRPYMEMDAEELIDLTAEDRAYENIVDVLNAAPDGSNVMLVTTDEPYDDPDMLVAGAKIDYMMDIDLLLK